MESRVIATPHRERLLLRRPQATPSSCIKREPFWAVSQLPERERPHPLFMGVRLLMAERQCRGISGVFSQWGWASHSQLRQLIRRTLSPLIRLYGERSSRLGSLTYTSRPMSRGITPPRSKPTTPHVSLPLDPTFAGGQ